VIPFPWIVVVGGLCVAFGDSPQPIFPLAAAIGVLMTYLIARQIIVYVVHLERPWSEAFGAWLAICGMSPSVGVAWLRGWVKARTSFDRTPKQPQPRKPAGARVMLEALAGILLAMLSVAILARFRGQGLITALGVAAYATTYMSSVIIEALDRSSAKNEKAAGVEDSRRPATAGARLI